MNGLQEIGSPYCPNRCRRTKPLLLGSALLASETFCLGRSVLLTVIFIFIVWFPLIEFGFTFAFVLLDSTTCGCWIGVARETMKREYAIIHDVAVRTSETILKITKLSECDVKDRADGK